ncbi:TPA: hypothetical protein DCX16_03565 [bacterium]|nr:hypothetical protein [bacterium]
MKALEKFGYEIVHQRGSHVFIGIFWKKLYRKNYNNCRFTLLFSFLGYNKTE